jgi:hypothetical protein
MKKLTLFFGLLLLAVIQPALADCPIYPSLNNPTYQAFYPPGLSAQVTISGKIVALEPSAGYWCDPSYANRINIYDNGKLAKTLTGVWYNGYSFSTTVEFGVGLHEVRVEACRDSACGSSTIYVEVISDGIQKSCTVLYYQSYQAGITTNYYGTLYIDIPREGHRLKVYPGQGIGVYGWMETTTYLRNQNINVGMQVYVDGVYKGSDGGSTRYNFIDLGNGQMRSYVAVTVGDLTPGSHTATIIHYGYNGATCSFTVNFTVEYLNPTVLKVNPSSSSNRIVGAPGSWCRYAGGNNYICGDKSGVVAYELDDTARKATPIQRNDPKVSTLSNVITRLYYLYSDTCDDLGYCYRTYYDYVYYIGLSSAQLWIYPLNPNPSYSSRDAAGYDTMSIPIKIKSSGYSNMFYVSIINLQTGRKEVDKLDMNVYYNTKEVQASLTPSSKSYLVQIAYRTSSGAYANGYQGTISSSIISTADPPKAIPGAVIISNVPKYSCSNDDNSGFQVDPKTTAVLYSGGYASLSTQLYYCKYQGTAVLSSTYAITCCRVSDEVLTLPVKAEPLGVGDTVGIVYCINEACQASGCSGYSGTEFSGSKQVLIPVSNTMNPDYWGAVTGTVSTAGYQIPPPNSNPFTSTPYLTFPDLVEHPATEQGITFKNLPLFQAMLPVKITYGCAKDTWNQPCNDEPHAGFYSGIAICKPSDIRVNGQSYYVDPSNRGGLKAFLINPVDNKPGARNNTSITIEYFSVEGRVATRHTIPVTVERGYAFVEGSNFNLIFNIDTTSPITGAWMQNGSQNITGEILDAKTARFPWTGKRYNETWTVKVCNAEGKCNQTYVTVLGTAPADVPVYSTPVPVPGSLVLSILYPQNGASVPLGSLTARAEAYVSGGYGRVTSVDFNFAIYDPDLASYRTVCGVTRTSPDTGNEYRATCTLNEPGEYMLSVFARDSNGNNAAKSVKFTVGGSGSGGGGSSGGSGSQPPTITQFNYPMYCINDGSSVTVTFSASAPNGLKEARLYTDGQLATSTSLSGTSANNVQMSFRAAFNGKQSITIRLVVEDTAGLTAEASGLLVACNRCPDQPPVVSIIEPSQEEYRITQGNTYPLPVTVSYSDDSAVKRLDLYINELWYFGIDLDSKSGTIVISPDIVQIELPQGNYTLKAVVKDSCNQATEAVKTVKIKKEEERINLVWTFKKYSDSLAYTNKGPINYLSEEYYSVGDMQMSLPSRPPPTDANTVLSCNYEGTCEVYLKPTASLGNSQPSGDGNIILGWYDPSQKLVHFDGPCAADMAGSNVIYNIYKELNYDYKYEFKTGCCRYECMLESRLGGTVANCVKVC